MKRTKRLSARSAKRQFHLLAVFFENILIRADTVNIWLFFGTGGLTDVAPVVRCKGCEYNIGTKKCLNPDSFFAVPKDDDFCSYGERKDGADAER